MAVEWAIMSDGRTEIGDNCRKEVRIDKGWEILFDGAILDCPSTIHEDQVGAAKRCREP